MDSALLRFPNCGAPYRQLRPDGGNHEHPLVGPMDGLIAAHALSTDATLVTKITREFGRVPGLETVNWSA
jgi:predicted nucleic acid-binding protein